MTPKVVIRRLSTPICSTPPTKMIPEMAFVSLIRGVWRAWATLEMT